MRSTLLRILLLLLLVFPLVGQAQTTTNFTYQGYLEDGGTPANGTYDFYFQLYDLPTLGTQQGTNRYAPDTVVTNGQFTVLLDWGYSVFPGAPRFLQIYVRLGASTGSYQRLIPRQQLTPVPYAIAALNAWRLGGNGFTTPGANFLGTTDNQALEFKVNNLRALRLEPNATSPNLLGGYSGNTIASGVYGAVIAGGGDSGTVNSVYDHYSTVSGGFGNRAGTDNGNFGDASEATVGGGFNNLAGGMAVVVSGGANNAATATCTAIGGGLSNQAGNDYAAVGGGMANTASGLASMIPGGMNNVAAGQCSFAAGTRAKANHQGAFVWGDSTNADITSDFNNQFKVRAGGGMSFLLGNGQCMLAPSPNSMNVLLGCSGNTFNAGVEGATVSGGGVTSYPNSVTGNYGTVSGGYRNTADVDATVGGGVGNRALAYSSTVAGGYFNTASGQYATVGGGSNNTAANYYATVPGGDTNTASGWASFAAGHRAKATADGAFAWADDSVSLDFTVSAANRFGVRATGGVYFYTNSSLNAGVYLTTGSGTWTNLSDRNAKTDFTALDPKTVLAKLVRIPLSSWRYIGEDAAIRHYGPMAQDFYAAFHLGDSDKGITTVDADGVALAAIQGLYQQTREENAQLRAQVTELRRKVAEVDKLKARLVALEQLLMKQK